MDTRKPAQEETKKLALVVVFLLMVVLTLFGLGPIMHL